MPEVTYDNPWGPEKLPPMAILNLEAVVSSKDLHPAIRGLAYSLMQNLYLNIGFFFRSLDDKDIKHFLDLFNQASEEYNTILENQLPLDLRQMPATSQVSTLCFLLARAEGDCELTSEVLHNAINVTCTLFFLENLARSKKLQVKRSNYSLGKHNYPIIIGKSLADLKRMKDEGEI